jgi:predicted ATPase
MPNRSFNKLIVLTGGPGAGKSAIMEASRQIFGKKIIQLPEAASIVYTGGFPRKNTKYGIMAAQRAISCVQRELEEMIFSDSPNTIALCDRGIMDGGAYWPGGLDEFCQAVGFTKQQIFDRYHTVIHLHTPSAEQGYNNDNPIRIETAAEAQALDEKIRLVWRGHPNLHEVQATEKFTDKIEHVTALIAAVLPK